VRASETYRMFIITLPVGPYYDRPVSLITETEYVRAAQGGVGEAKAAGNYAASLFPARMAREKGYHQVLWLDAKEHKYVEEVGTMNIFFVIDEKVVTPATLGTILKGVTRDCCIQIIKDQGIEVEERRISIDEVISAYRSGLLREVFGTGTAALVANVERIAHQDTIMHLSPDDWSISLMVKEEINGLRDGSVVDARNWMVPVTEGIYA
jgi:branched-chain amino acid aminotransferase